MNWRDEIILRQHLDNIADANKGIFHRSPMHTESPPEEANQRELDKQIQLKDETAQKFLEDLTQILSEPHKNEIKNGGEVDCERTGTCYTKKRVKK